MSARQRQTASNRPPAKRTRPSARRQVDETRTTSSASDLRVVRRQHAEEVRRLSRLLALQLDQVPIGDMKTALKTILRTALDITGAAMGDIRMADDRGAMTVAAQVGFTKLTRASLARADARMGSPSGLASGARRRVVLENVRTDATLADSPARPWLLKAGVLAMQSTPLLRDAKPVGVISTYYRKPHEFSGTETRWLDLLTERATPMIERLRLEEELLRAKDALEQQVNAAGRSMQVALDGARAGTWRIDQLTGLVDWDERSRRMFGIEDAGLVPFDPTFEQAHPDDRVRLQRRWQEIQQPGDDRWDMEFRLVHADGKVMAVHGYGQAERAPDGRLLALAGINLDVTSQKAIEEALVESRATQRKTAETLQSMLAGSAEGILTTSPDGIIMSANAALESMFGYSSGELVGQPLARLVPRAVRSTHAQQHALFWQSPQSRPMGRGLHLSGQRKDGTTFPIEASLTPITTESGVIAIAFVTDVTDRRRADENLRQSHAALQTAVGQLRRRTEQLRRFASDLTLAEQHAREALAKMMHDDLQQLLFSAKLRIDRLVMEGAAAGEVPGSLEKARTEVEQAIAAARSLSVELFPPELHDRGLATALVWLGGWMQTKYGLTVDVTADPSATLLQKDRRTLAFESVRELLFNVVKHAKVLRAQVDLALTSENQIRLTVADQGVGFDPAVVLDRRATQPAGWGLFSIRERAMLLGARFEIDSAPGRGTRFVLQMSRGDEQGDATGPPLRILLADDHAWARAGLREILAERPEFAVVGEAASGTEAVEQAHALRPDVIVMDASMSDLDGVEATRRIRAALPDCQIFGLSTQERPEELDAMAKAGAAGCFAKWEDAGQLIARLLVVRGSMR